MPGVSVSRESVGVLIARRAFSSLGVYMGHCTSTGEQMSFEPNSHVTTKKYTGNICWSRLLLKDLNN